MGGFKGGLRPLMWLWLHVGLTGPLRQQSQCFVFRPNDDTHKSMRCQRTLASQTCYQWTVSVTQWHTHEHLSWLFFGNLKCPSVQCGVMKWHSSTEQASLYFFFPILRLNKQESETNLSRQTNTDRRWWLNPTWSYLCWSLDTPGPCRAPPLIAWGRKRQRWRKRVSALG